MPRGWVDDERRVGFRQSWPSSAQFSLRDAPNRCEGGANWAGAWDVGLEIGPWLGDRPSHVGNRKSW